MNLQPRNESITVQKEFLYSVEMLSFKVGGITLDAAQWADEEVIKAGTIVMLPANGLAVPYATATRAGAEVYVTAHDVINRTGVNAVTGAVQEGYLHADKITGTFTAATLEADSGYRLKVRG
jgi:hypothetical protein